MLVLSRKVGEKIRIGNDVTVVVTRIAGNRVTLGVRAPDDVRILRTELDAFPARPVKRQPVLSIDIPATD